jgi:hypothetical protein
LDGFEIQPPTTKPKAQKKKKSSAPVPEFKPKLAPRPKRKTEPPKAPVLLNLGVKHFINGRQFGPGVTEVPADLVAGIMENEQYNAAEERKLREDRSVLITRGNRTMKVASDFFDNPETLPVA